MHIKGLIRFGTMGDNTTTGVIFVLPAGYRPAKRCIVMTLGGDNGAARTDVYPTGEITASYGGSNAFRSLDGITFRAEQ